MTEMSELREVVYDLKVATARLEERVEGVISAVDELKTQLGPLSTSVAKGKGYLAGVALVAAAIGGGLRELFNWFGKGGSS